MRKLALLVVLLLFCSLDFAIWQKSVNVLVLDDKGRPVPRAKVTMTWQFSERDQVHEQVGYTGFMGIASFNMSNHVMLEQQVKYLANAEAEYGAASLLIKADEDFDVRGYPDPLPLTLKLNKFRVHVFTNYGKPVEGASVYIAPWTKETGPSGSAEFLVPSNKIPIEVEFWGTRASKTQSVSNDAEINITLELYRLSISVLDSYGAQRPATTKIGNKTYSTDSNGFIRFDPFPGKSTEITIESGGLKRTVPVVLTSDKEIIVSFDSVPPKIGDVARTALDDGKKTVTARIEDEGAYASGLKSVTLYWRIEGDEQLPMEMYPQDASSFAATLPAQPEGVEVSYYIKAVDKQGNSVSSARESYGKPQPIINQTINQTWANQTAGNQSGVGDFFNIGQINWWLVIGVGAILIVAIIVYIYIKEE